MHVIKTNMHPRIINSLDELPKPEEMLVVSPTITLLQWALIMETIVGDDLIEDSEN